MEFWEELNQFYETEGQEELRLQEEGPQYIEFLTAVRALDRYLPVGAKVLDSCAGSGAYAFLLAQKGHKVTAGDVVPYNVEILRSKQGKTKKLEEIYLGDSRDLSRFPAGSFDAVLCMGALYHLHEREDRARALLASIRVLKEGGLLFCTYMNRYAVILNNCEGDLSNMDEILAFLKEGREGIFYTSTPKQAEEELEAAGAEKICHIGLDGMSVFLHQTAGIIDEAGLKRWREYHFAVCEEQSLLGSSYHNMLIARKRG